MQVRDRARLMMTERERERGMLGESGEGGAEREAGRHIKTGILI